MLVGGKGIEPMASQFDNDEDRRLHFNTIHALSELYDVDEARLREIYESKLEELSLSAKITSFLPVLAERHIKNILRSMQGSPI
jgi:hypothetical protein